jgi:DNA-binding transcriptional MocR family regulator
MSLAISNHAKVSNVSALMAISLLSDHNRLGSLISASNAALRIAANVIVDFLVSRDVQFHHPVAGVFVWARLGGYDMESLDDEVEMSRAFSAAGVELVAGRSCRAPQPGWFRVTFALPQNDLLLGLERISGVLDVLHDKIRSKRVRT